VTHWYS